MRRVVEVVVWNMREKRVLSRRRKRRKVGKLKWRSCGLRNVWVILGR